MAILRAVAAGPPTVSLSTALPEHAKGPVGPTRNWPRPREVAPCARISPPETGVHRARVVGVGCRREAARGGGVRGAGSGILPAYDGFQGENVPPAAGFESHGGGRIKGAADVCGCIAARGAWARILDGKGWGVKHPVEWGFEV